MPIIIDDPQVVAAFNELARRWNIDPEEAVRRACEAMLDSRQTDDGRQIESDVTE